MGNASLPVAPVSCGAGFATGEHRIKTCAALRADVRDAPLVCKEEGTTPA